MTAKTAFTRGPVIATCDWSAQLVGNLVRDSEGALHAISFNNC